MIMSKRIHKNPVRVAAVLLAFILTFGCIGVVPARAAEPNIAQFTTSSGEVRSYTSLSTAITAASLFGHPTIYLTGNYTLPGNLTIPDQQTVVIPTSDAYNDTETGVANVSGAGAPTEAYVTLTVPDGVTLEVAGTLLVAGNQQSSVPRAGFLTGSYGAIQLEGDLVINGTLYARGQINGGGTLTANKGSTVYQRFEVADWRGGNASLSAYENREHSVYPFELYQTGGVNVSAVYMNGSKMMGQSFIYSNQQAVGAISTVNIIGSSNSLLTFDDANDTDASIDFAYDTTTGVFTATINGSVSTGDISVDISIFGIHFPLTATGVGPFGYVLNVILPEKSTFNVSNELKLLPGCTITVNKDATLNASGRLYAYTSSAYSADYNNAHWTNANDAIIEILDGGILKGNIGSPDPNFGNIHGVTLTENMTSEKVWEVTQSGTTVTFHDIDFHMSSVA